MAKACIASLFLILFTLHAEADTICFKDGMKVEVPSTWEEDGQVKCNILGVIVGYPMADVARIEKAAEPFSDSDTSNRENTPQTVMVATSGQSITSTRGTPTYRLVDEKIYDAPIKTQIVQRFVVSGPLTEDDLRQELINRFQSAISRRGFKYHKQPTNTYIYIYGSEEQVPVGSSWLGMILKDPGDAQPAISIDEKRLEAFGEEPQIRFGLSEAKRKQIFYELVAAEHRASKEAMSKVPSNQPMKQIELDRKLEEKYKTDLTQKHDLTEDQVTKIVVEGVEKGWPRPRY